jgi:hypothetical protein
LSTLRAELDEKKRSNFELVQTNDSLHIELEYNRSELAKKDTELTILRRQSERTTSEPKPPKSTSTETAMEEERQRKKIKREAMVEEEEELIQVSPSPPKITIRTTGSQGF